MLITADRVLTGTEVLSPGWIEVTDGVIAGIGGGVPDGGVDTALGAVTVVPGFVDMHTHGGGSGAFRRPPTRAHARPSICTAGTAPPR